MRHLRLAPIVLLVILVAASLGAAAAVLGQAVDVYINITGGGTKKLNVAIPDFAVTPGPTPAVCRGCSPRWRPPI